MIALPGPMPKMTQPMNICRKPGRKNILALLAGLACCLLVGAGCHKVQLAPPVTYPSVVTTRAGLAYYVSGLRIPGTIQELKLKEGGTLTWVLLRQVSAVRFTQPACNNYRPAIIYLTGAGHLQGDVFVDFLIEGTTDMGYWNMSMRNVESLAMGTD
jgi:hypothetical protein